MSDEKRLYVVCFERGVMVVRSTPVLKETKLFYYIKEGRDDGYAFGYSSRVDKGRHALSEVRALESYAIRRMRDRDNAQAVVEQATSQIAEAQALLKNGEPAPADDAVGLSVEPALTDHAR